MGHRLIDPRRLAAQVIADHDGDKSEPTTAVEALLRAVRADGRNVTGVITAPSPKSFDEARRQAQESDGKRIQPPVGLGITDWPVAQARRRDDPIWQTIALLDTVETKQVPKASTRLLPFLAYYHAAYTFPRPGTRPTADDVPPGTVNATAALRTMCDAWDLHDRISSQVTAKMEQLADLATAASGLLAFSLVGRPKRCTLLVLLRPTHTFEDGALHAWNQPAVRWPDGTGEWYWRGSELPRPLAAKLPTISAGDVVEIRNTEVRRLALEYMGIEAFVQSADASLAAQDDYGKLWRTEIRLGGEPFVAVEVVNSTAEPDGTYRRYFLRVPPDVKTARDAVAWTFGFDNADDYILMRES